MPRHYKYRCLKCGNERERHCNAKLCHCGGRLVRADAEEGCCPTCGRPFKYTPTRFCRKCKKPITSGHKWRTVNLGGNLTTLEHRNCSDPKSYQPEGS